MNKRAVILGSVAASMVVGTVISLILFLRKKQK